MADRVSIQMTFGVDGHGRRLSLIYESDAGLTVVREAANQRDETVRLDGLSFAQLQELGRVASAIEDIAKKVRRG